jgi:hypothetical protein
MYTIELNAEEHIILLNSLEICLGELRMEITKTDNTRYKMMLKKRKEILQGIKERLSESLPELPLAE